MWPFRKQKDRPALVDIVATTIRNRSGGGRFYKPGACERVVAGAKAISGATCGGWEYLDAEGKIDLLTQLLEREETRLCPIPESSYVHAA